MNIPGLPDYAGIRLNINQDEHEINFCDGNYPDCTNDWLNCEEVNIERFNIFIVIVGLVVDS